MSAKELAIQADIDAGTLSKYEAGQQEMKVGTLHRIAAALKVPLSYLQSSELDKFTEIPREFQPLLVQLQALPADKKRMMLNMFKAQISSL